MRFERTLAEKNLRRKPARTAALGVLAAFLSLSVFGGSLAVWSLRRGLSSYQARLGADVIVVPNQARNHGILESILLQGIPGYFYMDADCMDKIRAMDGVAAVTPQFFLASASAGCCSTPVQVIGFDPETDFSIQPWIRESGAAAIGDGELLAGSGITVPANRELTFYNTPCRVAAQLDETGTGLDSAVYANMNTIRAMMKNAQSLGFHYFDGVDPDRSVSSVLVRVEEGRNIGSVTDDINIHVRRVQATQAKRMVSGIAGGLAGVSRMIGILAGVIWILALAVLATAFGMTARERTREFAVLRVMGASGRMLSRLLLWEAAFISFSGAAAGVGTALLLGIPFRGLLRQNLDLPYLLPGAGPIAGLAAGAVVLTVLAGALASAGFAYRAGRRETGLMLRESA